MSAKDAMQTEREHRQGVTGTLALTLTLTLGRRKGKNSASATGDRTQGLSFVHECSYNLTLHVTNVSGTLLGDCYAAVYSQQRPTQLDVIRCTD